MKKLLIPILVTCLIILGLNIMEEPISQYIFNSHNHDGINSQLVKNNNGIIASVDLISQTATATLINLNLKGSGNFHTYTVGGYLTLRAVTSNTVTWEISYIDENGQSITTSLQSKSSAYNAVPFSPMTIRVQTNSTLKIFVSASGIGSQLYDAGAYIQQIN